MTVIEYGGNILHSGMTVNVGSISTNIPYTFTVYCIVDNAEQVPDISIVRVKTKNAKIVKAFENNVVYTEKELDVPFSIVDNKYAVWPIHVIYESETANRFDDIITINDTFTINIIGEYVAQDERLQILLNNMGKELNLDWYQAFASTKEVTNINVVDNVFLNEKRRQLLLDFLQLTQLKGSYNSVKNGLAFFGYDGIVELLEYWKAKDGVNAPYSIFGQWSVFEDNSKVNPNEYYKTYYCALRYQINVQDQEDPYDDDGIPNMVERYLWDDYMFVKLNILKDVLQKYFLPDDIRILDIIGEHTSYARYALHVWLNELQILRYNSDHTWKDIEIEKVGDSEQYLQERKLILNLGVYALTTESPGIEFISRAEPDKVVYRVFKDETELEGDEGDLRDYELVTGFFRGDCAVIGVKPIKLVDGYQYGIALWQKTTETAYQQLYYSGKVDYVNIKDNLRFCVRNAGIFKVIFYVFDKYGACFQQDFDFDCKFPSFIPAIQFWRPFYENEDNTQFIRRDIIFDDVMETNFVSSQLFAYDLSWPDYDVNNPNFGDDVPNAIRRKYKGNEVMPFVLDEILITKLRKIELSKLNQVPLCEYSDGYEVLMFDMPKFPAMFRFQMFESDKDYIEAEDIHDFLTKINALKEDSAWKRWYSFDIHPVSFRNDDNTLTEPEYKLLLFGKIRGTTFERCQFKNVTRIEWDEDPDRSVILEQGFTESYTAIEPIEKWSIFPYFSLGPAIRIFEEECNLNADGDDTLYVKVGVTEYEFQNCTSFVQIADTLKKVKELYTTYHNGSFAVNVLKYGSNLTIKHRFFGTRCEYFRKSPIEYLYYAAKGHVYEPGTFVFATVDTEWKIDNYNISWNISEHFTQESLFDCNNTMLKWTTFKSGIYDITLSLQDKRTGELMTTKINGGITVK